MEIEFTVKIKDEQNPPTFNEKLGKGVLEKIVVDFKNKQAEDLNTDVNLLVSINELMSKLKEDWIEITYKLK